ncbi:MAG: energy-coupling factor transporter ATPase [Clostridia bacterium]|nr:energy-coupling factor transporter ATPase [Clostridia bacterium]
MQPFIQIKDVVFRYEGEEQFLPALNGVSLDIDEGRFVAILGHNGSGKSTLAKLFNGIYIPQSGSVTVCGMDTADETHLLDIRSTVGLVFQNPDNQIVSSVVEEDVAFAPENLGIASEEIRRRVDSALKTVDMYEYRRHSPHLLSGGQKQRVAIAGVLAMQPRCIVLDEPTAMLDPRGRREVIDTVTRLCREKGMTVILITHHMAEAIEADKIFVMSDGRIALQGSPEEIFFKVGELKALGLAVPDTTAVIDSLNAAGFSLDYGALTVDKCAAEIAAQFK